MEQSWLDSLKQFIRSPAKVKREIIKDASRSQAELAEEVRRIFGFSLEPHVSAGNTLRLVRLCQKL
jgi:hypothetical protein